MQVLPPSSKESLSRYHLQLALTQEIQNQPNSSTEDSDKFHNGFWFFFWNPVTKQFNVTHSKLETHLYSFQLLRIQKGIFRLE